MSQRYSEDDILELEMDARRIGREEGRDDGRAEMEEEIDDAINDAREVGRLSIIINKKRDANGDVVVTVNAGGWQGKNMRTATGHGEPTQALLFALRCVAGGVR